MARYMITDVTAPTPRRPGRKPAGPPGHRPTEQTATAQATADTATAQATAWTFTGSDKRMLVITLVGTLVANLLTGLFVVLALFLVKLQQQTVCVPQNLPGSESVIYGNEACYPGTNPLYVTIFTAVTVACFAAAATIRWWWPRLVPLLVGEAYRGTEVKGNVRARSVQALLAAVGCLGVLLWLALAGALRVP